jgi:hypothetical protein
MADSSVLASAPAKIWYFCTGLTPVKEPLVLATFKRPLAQTPHPGDHVYMMLVAMAQSSATSSVMLEVAIETEACKLGSGP